MTSPLSIDNGPQLLPDPEDPDGTRARKELNTEVGMAATIVRGMGFHRTSLMTSLLSLTDSDTQSADTVSRADGVTPYPRSHADGRRRRAPRHGTQVCCVAAGHSGHCAGGLARRCNEGARSRGRCRALRLARAAASKPSRLSCVETHTSRNS